MEINFLPLEYNQRPTLGNFSFGDHPHCNILYSSHLTLPKVVIYDCRAFSRLTTDESN